MLIISLKILPCNNIKLTSLWSSPVAPPVKNLPSMGETWIQSLGWEDALEKEIAYPFQYSGLENFMDYIVHTVAKHWIRLSDFHFC